MRTNKLLKYGLFAGIGYLIYKQMQPAAPVVAVTVPSAPAVSGFGYFPDGSDRPFQPGLRTGQYWGALRQGS